jgi:hypothetical protein
MFDGLLRADDPACPVRLGPQDSILSFWSSRELHRIWTYCAVVHRGDGTWTHLYAIERLPEGATVHLLKFWQGEQLAVVTRWMRERRGRCARCLRAASPSCTHKTEAAHSFYEVAA